MPVILLINTYLNFQVEFMIKSGLKIFITLLSYSWLILYTDRYRYINKVIHFRIAKVSARTGRTIVPALLIRLQYFIESKRGGINVNNRAATTNIGWATKIKKEREKKKEDRVFLTFRLLHLTSFFEQRPLPLLQLSAIKWKLLPVTFSARKGK